MTISITEKEYDAICFAIQQIKSQIESASEESFIDDATSHNSALYRIKDKYLYARYRVRGIQGVRDMVVKKYKDRNLTSNEINKIARKFYRYLEQRCII